jgi:hypothetical protein
MTRDQFLAYLDDYNSGDPERLAAHYTPDVVFENYGHRQSGAEAIGFLTWLASVVQARMTPRQIWFDGDQIALEADMVVTALADLPDLPIGALRQGDTKVSRTFAFYTTDGPLIRHVRLAGWPPREPD